MKRGRGAREAALLGDNIEIAQVMVVEPIHRVTLYFGITEGSIRKGVLVQRAPVG